MKNTKKLLIVFAAIVILASTVFAVATSAVVAGEGTSMEEYTEMKVSVSHGFEGGTSSPLFGSVMNGGYGAVLERNNARPTVRSVYSDDVESTQYYIIDYYMNTTGKHHYIQPKLGDLNKAEKTPVNGFISEFDIAFFSPIEILQEQEVDLSEDAVKNRNGLKWKGIEKKDENGNRKMYYNGDTNENGIIDPGENWEPVMVNQKEPLLDANGEPVVDAATGEVVMVDKAVKGDFDGLSTSFTVAMNNTGTNADGNVSLMSFKTNSADATVSVSVNKNLLENAPTVKFKADEWCHVTVQYDAVTMLTYIYIGIDDSYLQDTNEDGVIDENDKPGRLLIGTIKAIDTVNGNVMVYPLQFRMGGQTGCISGIVGFDNFIAYQGTTVHNPLLISALPAYRQYIYVATILDPEYMSTYDGTAPEDIVLQSAVNRYQAYEYLRSNEEMQKVAAGNYFGIDENGKNISSPGSYRNLLNAALRLYKTVYNADELNGTENAANVGKYDKLVEAVKKENAALYLQYAQLAAENERTFANASQREASVKVATDFHDASGSLMDRECDDYNNAVKYIAELNKYIQIDKNSHEFIKCMEIFKTSLNSGASVSRLKYHYANATSYLEAGIAEDRTGLDQESIESLDAALEAYEEAGGDKIGQIFDEVCKFNSIRFISIVDSMQSKSSGVWANDGDDVMELWILAYDIIYSGEYDENYEGFAVRKVIYDLAGKHFWAVLQNEHLSVITAKLNDYDKSDATYIDRAGICTYVDRYLEANAAYLDKDNIELQREITRNESYKERLTTLVGDYKNLLVQNTTEFINTMKQVSEYNTYDMLKPLYDKANEYYYMMNVDGEEISVYIEQYEQLRALVTNIEKDSEMYIGIVMGTLVGDDGAPIYTALSDMASLSAIYESLSTAYLYTEHLDMTYPGAKEAKDMYDAKYQEYHDSIKVANTRIANSENLVYSVRGNWDFDSVVAFVKKLLTVKE